MKAVESAFLSRDYATLSSNTYDSAENERKILQHMLARRVDALIVHSTGQNEELLRAIADSGTPVILYDRRSRDHQFPTVYVNKQKAMYLALDHLLELGHRRVLLATGSKLLSTNYDRYMGVQKYIFDRDLDPARFPARFGAFSVDFGSTLMEEIAAMPERPTAVITGSVAITAGIIVYCKEHGLSIPDDIAIVSAGTFSYPSLIEPDLTYLDDFDRNISSALIELAGRALQGEAIPDDARIEIEPALRVGASTVKTG